MAPVQVSATEAGVSVVISRRDLVIDLGDGLTTAAQLTFPAGVGGPFPGILLVHGSGPGDMNEYIPPYVTGTGEPARPFLQLAEYLSERGFAVLRYNKRGVGLNGTLLNPDIYYNMTFQDLVRDADRILEVLVEQEEVEGNDITIIGWSEGTYIAPRIAIANLKVKKIVLLAAGAHNLYNITYFQLVDRPIFYAEDTIDSDHNGLLSVQEVYTTFGVELVEHSPLPPNAMIENSTGEWLWYPGLDADGDDYFSIHEELKPLLLQGFEYYTTAEYPGSVWLQSHFALDSNLAIIGNVSASILILQGEGDTQARVEQAFLLDQRLREIEHPDHTLITYPSLGHSFYPADGWIHPLGPMQERVLSDLAVWLIGHSIKSMGNRYLWWLILPVRRWRFKWRVVRSSVIQRRWIVLHQLAQPSYSDF